MIDLRPENIKWYHFVNIVSNMVVLGYLLEDTIDNIASPKFLNVAGVKLDRLDKIQTWHYSIILLVHTTPDEIKIAMAVGLNLDSSSRAALI
jgi:hypothetical protein